MSRAIDRMIPRTSVDSYLARIDEHLGRLADGHDPPGHLFAIERLARAARAEWLALEQPRDPEQGRA